MNYYNEHDPKMAAWLRQLIADGLIPDGRVDERSIVDVCGGELLEYEQCHFFAGIGGWSRALQLAGWPRGMRVWTGSCPCQPFSAAGKGRGAADERHLWPVFFRLIGECRPDVVFGEQVENAIAHGWLDGIRADLEGEGYAVGDATLGAHSAGAPHQRQRLYWVADAHGAEWGQDHHGGAAHGKEEGEREQGADRSGECGAAGSVAESEGEQCHGSRHPGAGRGEFANGGGLVLAHGDGWEPGSAAAAAAGYGGAADAAGGGADVAGGLGDASGEHERRAGERGAGCGWEGAAGGSGDGGGDFWAASRWIECRDGKWRRIPTEPGLFPLADGISYRVALRGSVRAALLGGAGNAIVPQTAALFVRAWLDLRLTKNENENQ